RLPQNRYCIENRATDMTMNAYLALGCTTAAVVKGLKEKLDAGPPLGRDLYLMKEEEFEEAGVQRLPRSLSEAVDLFEADGLMKDVLGAGLHKSYCEYKRDEWERYSVSISEWEIEEYLKLY
ncbi:MAG: glutamine synthetase, partial [Hyphomicrobiaceae bacterium]